MKTAFNLNWFRNQEPCIQYNRNVFLTLALKLICSARHNVDVIKHFSTFLFYFLIFLKKRTNCLTQKLTWEELILSIKQSHHLRESCKNKENSQIIHMNMTALNSHLLMVVPQERLFLVVWRWCFHQPWLGHKHLLLYKNQGLLLSDLGKDKN